jgi:hypothetical protein
MTKTPDGWVVPPRHFAYLGFVADHDPPRAGAFWFQFTLDARSRLPWVLWSFAAVGIARGLAYGQWGHVVFGGGLLVAYLVTYLMAAWQLRTTPAAVAVLDTLTPHPVFKHVARATVRAGGREVRLIVPLALVAEIGDGQAEVVYLDVTPGQCLVIAGRPVPKGPSSPPARSD